VDATHKEREREREREMAIKLPCWGAALSRRSAVVVVGPWRLSLITLPLVPVDMPAYSVEPHIKVGLFQHSTLYEAFPAITGKLFCTRGRG